MVDKLTLFVTQFSKMVSLVVLALTLFVGCISAAPNRIVGGTQTSTAVYPSIVQVDFFRQNSWGQACGGNIVTNRAIVSAAHCTHGAFDPWYHPQNRRIRAGANNRNTGGQIVNVQSILNHPTFNTGTLNADICIIRLSSNLNFNNNVRAISIVPQGFDVPDNAAVIHAGWGAIRTNGPASNVLLHVTVNAVNRNVCAQRYASANMGAITVNMICAGILNVGGRDACQGDSGGPLYHGNVLAGIISFGGDCADPFLPGVNARVGSYTNWIVQNA